MISVLGGQLHGPFHRGQGAPGGWVLLYEPELHLPDGDVLVPDYAGWRRDRLPTLPSTAWFELAPDWVCEVLSPGTAARDRTAKRRLYGREGVQRLWHIDPSARTLEVSSLEGGTWWKVAGTWDGDAHARVAPFDAIEIDLAPFWNV